MAARRPLPRPIADWLRVFGPGAIVASLPIMLLLMSVVCTPIGSASTRACSAI